MRTRLIGLVSAVTLAAAMAANSGCSSGTGATGSGGTTGGGGAGGMPAPNCPGGTPCGGSVVGSWTVASSCLALSGDMDVVFASLGCMTVPVTGSLHVTGTWTANSNGTYTDNTVTTGSITFPLAPACLSVSSTPVTCTKAASAFSALGWASTTCSDAGGTCTCTAMANQSAGIGVISPYAMPNGNYT